VILHIRLIKATKSRFPEIVLVLAIITSNPE